jgi:cytochrome c-type biogenesis protein CcmH
VKRVLLLATLLAILAGPVMAVTPDEQLADQTLEARAREVSQELRCVVCQNQSIDDSDAPLAHDLRVLLRERIAAGDSNAQAKAFIVQRYGHFVLLRPPVEGATLILWFGPLAVLVVGGIGVFFYLRGHARPELARLDASEEAEVAKLLSPDEAA